MTSLRDWHEFPQWKPHPLEKVFTNLEPAGIDLMAQMFIYNPARRISVHSAPSYAHPALQLKVVSFHNTVPQRSHLTIFAGKGRHAPSIL